MRLIHESDKTRIILQGNKVAKFFYGDYARNRFEKELGFYKIYKSHNLPHFVSETSDQDFSITTSFLKGESPGFLDQSTSGLLNHEQLVRIRDTLLHLQNLPTHKLLVHGDLAPHNIYITDDRVVIADWDSYWYTDDLRFRMYDYAFLWSMLDFNEEHLLDIFKNQELEDLKIKGLLNDFKFCFKKRVRDIQKYPSKFKTGMRLKEGIMKCLSS